MAPVLVHRIASRFAAQRVVFAHQGGDMKGDGLCGGLIVFIRHHNRDGATVSRHGDRLPLCGVYECAKLVLGGEGSHGEHGHGLMS